jgi:hypothetical protein
MAQSITALAVNVTELFSAALEVPRYQRDYEWTPKAEIKTLLDDLCDHFIVDPGPGQLAGGGADDDYMLGQVVMTEEPGAFELIDGQQRTITLFTLLCAIRYRLLELGEKPKAAVGIQHMLGAVGEDFEIRPKLRHHDELASAALETLLSIEFPAAQAELKGTNDSLSNRRIQTS